MFKIADQVFRINKAHFHARVSRDGDGWRLHWHVDFGGEGKEVNGNEWEPEISSQGLQLELPGFSSWSGVECAVADAAEDELYPFRVHVFEQMPLRQARLKFGTWQGQRIDLALTGLADLYADEDYQENLPVTVRCNLPFRVIVADADDLAQAEAAVEKFFDRKRLCAGRPGDESGEFVFEVEASSAD
ncbi:MAG: hypothetical protein LBL59_03085 [Xanthomonadaceae bacterium]|jgi:hypothetical protein|nr:hypothetical protein [Xanthomonadaceae bacterium]